MFLFEKEGDAVYCKGGNFEYCRLGTLSKFIQTGKIPSLRAVKTIIKKLQEA